MHLHHTIVTLFRGMSRLRQGGLVGLLVAAAIGLACSTAAMAAQDPPGRIGRLSDIDGKAWLMEDGQKEWSETRLNRPLTTGDRLATDAGGRATVEIGSSTLRLGEATDVEFAVLDDDRVSVVVRQGRVALRARDGDVAREFDLNTVDGTLRPRGPGQFLLSLGERTTTAASLLGDASFVSSDSELMLRAGQRADFWFDEDDSRTHYAWVDGDDDAFERWAVAEDARDDRYAADLPVSAEMTGSDDLRRYGTWHSHPEYGEVWTPTSVSDGWAPYRDGHWAWISPWGWTWVDDAPWGFAPFHYGRWVYWNQRWAWCPPPRVRRPVYAPAMVAWLGGPRVSVSVRIGGGYAPAVGWVPLAPHEYYYPSYYATPVYVQHVNVVRSPPPRHRRDDREPIMYTNRGVPGGVTVVSSDVLRNREPVMRGLRPARDVVIGGGDSGRATSRHSLATTAFTTDAAPPAPRGEALRPRVVSTASDVLRRQAVRSPAERTAVSPVRVARDRDERGDRQGALVRSGPPSVIDSGRSGTGRPSVAPRDERAREADSGRQARSVEAPRVIRSGPPVDNERSGRSRGAGDSTLRTVPVQPSRTSPPAQPARVVPEARDPAISPRPTMPERAPVIQQPSRDTGSTRPSRTEPPAVAPERSRQPSDRGRPDRQSRAPQVTPRVTAVAPSDDRRTVRSGGSRSPDRAAQVISASPSRSISVSRPSRAAAERVDARVDRAERPSVRSSPQPSRERSRSDNRSAGRDDDSRSRSRDDRRRMD